MSAHPRERGNAAVGKRSRPRASTRPHGVRAPRQTQHPPSRLDLAGIVPRLAESSGGWAPCNVPD